MRGGEGADTLDGGPGSDTADYSDNIVVLSVTLNGAVDAIVMVGGVAEDTIRNIENLIGGSGNDSFIGDIADNLFRGGAGNDTLDGGSGLDTADYSDKTEDVSVILQGAVDAIVTIGGVAEDTIHNIENLIGGSGNDTFIGDAMANRLSGGYGDDTLQGGAGNDTLDGGTDSDTIVFSGNLAEYSISYDFDHKTYTVTDSVSGRDGSDLVTGAEFFQFADGVHSVADLIDIVPPYLQSRTPSEYATNVAVGTDMVFTFTEPVQAGTGSITLQTGGTTVMTIDVTDTAQVSASGTTLTINPTADLASGTEYSVTIESQAIKDLAGNSFIGITSYNFTTSATTDHPPLIPMVHNGASVMPERYSGPATAAGGETIHFQLLGKNANDVISGTLYNDFINLLAGDDAVNAGAGNDVIDGGLGSNFLTGGAGTDIFFSDGRGGGTTWSTITDWQAGEQLSVWGWKPGISQIIMWREDGTEGYKGITMHADLDGNGVIDTSVTFTGVAQSDLPTPIDQFDGLLWFK